MSRRVTVARKKVGLQSIDSGSKDVSDYILEGIREILRPCLCKTRPNGHQLIVRPRQSNVVDRAVRGQRDWPAEVGEQELSSLLCSRLPVVR